MTLTQASRKRYLAMSELRVFTSDRGMGINTA